MPRLFRLPLAAIRLLFAWACAYESRMRVHTANHHFSSGEVTDNAQVHQGPPISDLFFAWMALLPTNVSWLLLHPGLNRQVQSSILGQGLQRQVKSQRKGLGNNNNMRALELASRPRDSGMLCQLSSHLSEAIWSVDMLTKCTTFHLQG